MVKNIKLSDEITQGGLGVVYLGAEINFFSYFINKLQKKENDWISINGAHFSFVSYLINKIRKKENDWTIKLWDYSPLCFWISYRDIVTLRIGMSYFDFKLTIQEISVSEGYSGLYLRHIGVGTKFKELLTISPALRFDDELIFIKNGLYLMYFNYDETICNIDSILEEPIRAIGVCFA